MYIYGPLVTSQVAGGISFSRTTIARAPCHSPRSSLMICINTNGSDPETGGRQARI